MTTKSAIYVLDAPGKITHMFVSESGFNIDKPLTSEEFTFSSNDIRVFNVSDQCAPNPTDLPDCLKKTEISNVSTTFSGNVLYLLKPNISLTKYTVNDDTEITMTENQIIIIGKQDPVISLSTTEHEASSTQVEPDISIGSDDLRPDEVGSSTVSESGEHEIVRAFNIAKGIAESITQSNSSNSTSTNTTASMTPSTLSSVTPWSKFG